MSTTASASVEERLSRLEKENRRLKVGGIAMLAGFVVIVIGGAAFNQIPDEIVARRFVVVGPQNQPRIVLKVNPGGVTGGIDIMEPQRGIRIVGIGMTDQ